MSYRVIFSSKASRDLLQIVEFIAADNEGRAGTFIAQLEERIRTKLAQFPNSAPAYRQYRYAVFGNYVTVYRVEERAKTVRIVLVTEGHRDWQHLLKARG